MIASVHLDNSTKPSMTVVLWSAENCFHVERVAAVLLVVVAAFEDSLLSMTMTMTTMTIIIYLVNIFILVMCYYYETIFESDRRRRRRRQCAIGLDKLYYYITREVITLDINIERFLLL